MKPWHCLLGVAAIAPSFAACYTYNIYVDDGTGGSTTSSTDATAAGSTSSDTGSSSSTMSSSSSGNFSCDSTGFDDYSTAPTNCPFMPTQLNYVDLSTDGPPPGWCILRHANENPSFVAGGKLRLDTRCSEWTPKGFGPFVYREVATADQDFAVWGTFEFDGDPQKQYQGAGVLMRWGALEDGQYAIADVYRHPDSGGTATFSLWHPENGNAKQEAPSMILQSYNGVRMGLCARKFGAVAPATHVISAYIHLPQNGFQLMASYQAEIVGKLQVGIASHAYGGGNLIPHVTDTGVAARLSPADPCFEGMLGPMN